jgi:hypothetical protein
MTERAFPHTFNTSATLVPIQPSLTQTHTKRQADQHDCLSSLLGDEEKGVEIVYGEGKNILYWAD